jgi:hypothetical protein
VARQNAAGDDVTVDVVSIEEAYAVAREAKERLDAGAPVTSLRSSLSPA